MAKKAEGFLRNEGELPEDNGRGQPGSECKDTIHDPIAGTL